ncbi:sensor histidine kinase KdpD [Sporosarcina sp. D27]|uniref:sensor histidine kinase n=1 Tax=Sporosarcina sp. D27 TaxID=1382305 RepID=UPI0004713103|nr:HAMP domain-containing sensor histidine kinase [Sporosarcina sp. D27]
MRRKITISFLTVIVVSSLLILLLTLTSIYFIIFSKNKVMTDSPNFTLSFGLHIDSKGNEISISKKGQQLLKDRNAFIQILDNDGYEVFELYKPDDAPMHYSPAQIVHSHMYSDTIKGYTIFVASPSSNSNLSYIIGFPSTEISKHTFDYEYNLFALLIKFTLLVLFISIIVFVITGSIFGKKLTNPIVQIIEGVELLSLKIYGIQYKEVGIYSRVFGSLNVLAENLKLSEQERQKNEIMREEWISNISHDLKTPLSTIKGYSEVLSDSDYDVSKEEIIRYSNIMSEKAIYMEEMIEELRLNEKLKHNVLTMHKTKNNLTKFLRSIVVGILNDPNHSGRQIIFNAPDEAVEYYFDQNLMKRAIENLLFNALIHNNEDVDVIVNLYKQEKITIEITDNGRGIREEDVEKLFNRYYRGTNTKDHKGSGLGMSIAKEVIEAHQGEITVKSQLNIGTTIRITL